jgi:hypothetical protein
MYVQEQIKVAINSIPITLPIRRVQEKVEGAAERSILSSALAKQRVYDLGIIEQERAKRNNKDNNKIV